MKLRANRSVFLVILVAAGFGCAPAEDEAAQGNATGATRQPSTEWKDGVPEIVAFVGTREIRRNDFLRAVELEGMRRVARSVAVAEALGRDEPPQEISAEQRSGLLEGMVENILVQVIGASEGIQASEEEIDARLQEGIGALGDTGTYEEFLEYYGYTEAGLRAELAEQVIRTKLLELLAEPCDAAEEEIAAEFDRLTEAGKLNTPAVADFWHIVVFARSKDAKDWKAAKEKVIEARARIVAGEEFELVAVEVSEEQTVHTTNGLSRRVLKSQIPEALQVAVFESETGELSDPIGTEYGWHLIKPVDRREAAPLTLEQARDPIRAQLVTQCQSEAFRARLDAARAEHPVSMLYPGNAQ